jgi:hypothetical protein
VSFDYIEQLYARRITNGRGRDTQDEQLFRPNADVTREAMGALLVSKGV